MSTQTKAPTTFVFRKNQKYRKLAKMFPEFRSETLDGLYLSFQGTSIEKAKQEYFLDMLTPAEEREVFNLLGN